jgi:hypothetical protein
MGHQAVLPGKRIKVLGLRDEGFGRRHDCQHSALPCVDDSGHPPRQGSPGCASVRPGMDCVSGSSSSRETFRQLVRCHTLVLKNGLSRMRGDSHVRFLGGGGAAMRRCYPTAWHCAGHSKSAPPTVFPLFGSARGEARRVVSGRCARDRPRLRGRIRSDTLSAECDDRPMLGRKLRQLQFANAAKCRRHGDEAALPLIQPAHDADHLHAPMVRADQQLAAAAPNQGLTVRGGSK